MAELTLTLGADGKPKELRVNGTVLAASMVTYTQVGAEAGDQPATVHAVFDDVKIEREEG